VNPIIEAVMGHIHDGKKVARLHPDSPSHTKKVTIFFEDGTSDDVPIECDHQTFLDWWGQSGAYLRDKGIIQ